MNRILPLVVRRIVASLCISCFLLCAGGAQAQIAVSGANPFPALPFPNRMVFLDADKDGDVDVLYQASNSSGVGWNYMQNNGNGTYTTIAASGTGTFTAGPFNGVTFTGYGAMYAFDYDGDGDVDLVDQQASTSRLLVNNGNGTFSVSGSNPFPALPFPTRMVIGDFDSDGDVDVLYQASNSSGVGWNYMQNNGNGTYTTIAASGTGTFTAGPFNGVTFTGYGAMYAFDYDRDGDVDLVDQQANSSRLLVNNNNTGFSVSGSNPFPALPFPTRMVIGDFDSDGDVDVLYQASNSSGVGWNYMQNNGNGTYTTIAASGTGTFTAGPFNGVTFTGYGFMYITDYDKDGDVDLVDQQANTSRLLYQTNTPPRMLSSTPSSGAGNALRDAALILNFSEAVVSGTGNIYIRKTSDNSIFATVAANGSAVTGTGTSSVHVVHPIFASNTSYYVTFDNTAFRDASGASFGTLPAGANYIMPITSSAFLSFTTGTALPLRLLSFAVTATGGSDLVTWQTAMEAALVQFAVEYSADGKTFAALTTVAPTNQSTGATYRWTNAHPLEGLAYYRMATYETSGAKTYSPVVAVHRLDKAMISLFPNPAQRSVTVQIGKGGRKLTLVDAGGRVLRQEALTGDIQTVRLSLESLSTGLYFIGLETREGELRNYAFIKN